LYKLKLTQIILLTIHNISVDTFSKQLVDGSIQWLTYFPGVGSKAVRVFTMFMQLSYFIDDILEQYFCSFAELAKQGLEEKHPLDILGKEMDKIWFQTDSRYNLQESDRKLIDSIPKYNEMLAAFEEYVMEVRKVAEPSTIEETPFINLWGPFVRSSSWYADKKDSVFKSESTFRYIR
jgi:hypothetical protein